jgi:spermidine/putrescine transport system substrate-binding protein
MGPEPRTAPISRRAVLKGTALAGFAAFLAACTGAKASPSPSAEPSAAASTAPTATPTATPTAAPATPGAITGPLMFANWPAYIDLAAGTSEYKPGSSPTLEQFKKKYGVDVNYQEKISENATFVDTIKPALVGGLNTGWDLIVITDWMASKVVGNKWAEKIDQNLVPNCTANLRDALRNQAWDPGNDYHYPWQSGMTGIGFNAATLKANNIPEPTKLADLWNIPAAKVTFLTESRDTFGLGLLKLGINPDPATVTAADLQKVYDDIKPLVDKGLRFTGNEYLQDFAGKKVWAAFVWSGDLASSAGPDDKFVFPQEGTMIWTDNMVIPKGATNKYTAELMMNWVYDPAIAAQIADYVFYVSPVKGADVEIKKIDANAATNPLLFPTADVVAKQRNFQALSADLETKLNALYGQLSGT